MVDPKLAVGVDVGLLTFALQQTGDLLAVNPRLKRSMQTVSDFHEVSFRPATYITISWLLPALDMQQQSAAVPPPLGLIALIYDSPPPTLDRNCECLWSLLSGSN